MDQHPLLMCRYAIRCRDGGHVVVTHGFGEFEYGRKEARTANLDELAYIDCFTDPTCSEAGACVQSLLSATGKKDWEIVECNNAVFGYACDPAPSGLRYDFSGVHVCPVCGSTNIGYGPVVPGVVETVYVPHVTHRAWDGLDETEKRELLRSALQENGCL